MTVGRGGLLVPAAVCWAVALGGTALPAAVPAVLVAGGAGAGVASLAARCRPTRRTVLLAAVLVCAVAVLAAVALAETRRHPPALRTGSATTAVLRVDQVRALAGTGGAGRHLVRGELLAAGGVHALAVPVVLFGTAAPPVGATVRVRVLLRRAAPTDQAACTGSLLGPARVVAPPSPPQAVASALHTRFTRATAWLPGDGGALLPGLAIGDDGRLGPDLTQAMRDSSLTHLTAVSGANCAVVTVGVLGLGALLRLPRAARLLLAGAALAGFTVLVTPQPSVVRAAVMAAVALGCLLAGRRTTGPPALALTVVVLLVLDPWSAWSPGFVLSVAATAGLLLLGPPLADRLGRVLPPRAALVLAVPVAAQAACQPVLLLLQPGLPLFGVLANLLAEPAAPVVTVLGLVACLVGPLAPALGAGLALLAWVPAAWIGLVARSTASLPALGWPPGATGAVLAAVLLAAGLLALRRGLPGPVRGAAGGAVAVALLATLGSAAGGAVGRSSGTPQDWTLAACDVGQGDGLVLNGGGRYAVVDTGREPGPILDCLDRLGVRRIDLLVLTHWDDDHVGAARAIADRLHGPALVGPVDGAPAIALRRDLAAAGADVQQARRGDAVRLGRLRLDVLWPPDPLGDLEPGNAASVTLLVTGGPRLLLTGDLGEEAQDALLAAGPLPAVDVLKVAHHGSGDFSPGFVAATGARVGVVSVGAGNDYGHPTARLLRALRADGVQAVRTDQDGLVLIGGTEGRPRLWTEHAVTSAVWTPAK